MRLVTKRDRIFFLVFVFGADGYLGPGEIHQTTSVYPMQSQGQRMGRSKGSSHMTHA